MIVTEEMGSRIPLLFLLVDLADPEFPRQRGINPKGNSASQLFLTFFPENCMNMKNIGRRRWVCIPSASANIFKLTVFDVRMESDVIIYEIDNP